MIEEYLNVEDYFAVSKELPGSLVLIKVDGSYKVMFHEFPLVEGYLKCKDEISLDKFYPFEAQKVVREKICWERHIGSTMVMQV